VTARLEALVDQVRAARDHGFASVWVSQHYLATPYQMLQPLPLLGRIAAEAGGMRIGTNIFLLPLQTPVYVAEQVAKLDVLTGGQFIFGCGLGYRPEEFRVFGVPMKARVTRSSRCLRWSGGSGLRMRSRTRDATSH
jgi:alkanesulfonate monooxygenase SsuD/methylene tetrahydromethanopterin reductase-like flavin-dependent oxidoreductase (luciferase family)